MDENRHIYLKLKELEKKWGVEAWHDICKYLGSIHDKLKSTQKSRDNWKNKYLELKNATS